MSSLTVPFTKTPAPTPSAPPESPQSKGFHVTASGMWTFFKISIVLLIIGIIVYFVVKYWKYIEIAGLVLGGLLAAAAVAPILAPILAGLAGLAVGAFGWAYGKLKTTKELSDDAKASGDTAKAKAIEDETKNTLESDSQNLSDKITENNNQADPNPTVPFQNGDIPTGSTSTDFKDATEEGVKNENETVDGLDASAAAASATAMEAVPENQMAARTKILGNLRAQSTQQRPTRQRRAL